MSDEKKTEALVVRDRGGLVRPVVSPADLINAHKEVAALVSQALEDGVDYGVIPGTKTKPTLLKPGAERLCMAFGAQASFRVIESEAAHDREVKWNKRQKVWGKQKGQYTWKEESGVSLGLYRYVIACDLVSRQTGEVISTAIGSCSSLETKFIDRPRDCENTVIKVAQKRALVAAVLSGFGLSNRFTQDVDDRDEVPAVSVAEQDLPPYPDSSQRESEQPPLVGDPGSTSPEATRVEKVLKVFSLLGVSREQLERFAGNGTESGTLSAAEWTDATYKALTGAKTEIGKYAPEERSKIISSIFG